MTEDAGRFVPSLCSCCVLCVASAASGSRAAPEGRRHAARRARRACTRATGARRAPGHAARRVSHPVEQAARPAADSDRAHHRRAARRDGRRDRVSAVDRSEAGRARSAARRLRARRSTSACVSRSRPTVRPATSPSRSTCATRPATLTSVTRPRPRSAQWTLAVVAGGKAADAPADPIVFDTIAFGHGEAPVASPPAATSRPGPPVPARPDPAPHPATASRARQIHRARHHRRLPQRRRLPPLHPQRGIRRQGTGPVRRPRTACDSADRVSRRPGAESDAVRAADDSDQPRDHRRRHAGRVARPRLPARLRVRRRDGARLRRPRAGRHSHGRHLRHDQLVAVVQPRHRGPVRRARPGDVRRPR